MTNIAIIGIGYAGLSTAVLLAQKNTVITVDADWHGRYDQCAPDL